MTRIFRKLFAKPLAVLAVAANSYALDATSTIQAEAFTSQSGVTIESCGEGGKNVTGISNGDFIAFDNIEFSSDVQCFQARVASYANGGEIELRLDSPTGTLIGTCEIQPVTGSWQTWTDKACAVTGADGTHTLYLVFKGGDGNLFNLNWFRFHGTPDLSSAHWRTSTSTKKGVYKGTLEFADAGSQSPTVTIFPDEMYQRVDGFGGAFNDNGWQSLLLLDSADREKVLRELFDMQNGCRFNIGRVPIGISDFTIGGEASLNEKKGDYAQENFSIAHDLENNIPYVKAAMKYQPNLMIFGSVWTPPTWMKTNSGFANGAPLTDAKTWTSYALYFRKFLTSWEEAGVPVYSVMVQNEMGFSKAGHPSCIWSGNQMRDFIRDYLYPDFTKNGIGAQIWLGTVHNSKASQWAKFKPTLDDPQAKTMIRGVGVQRTGAKVMKQALEHSPSLKLRGIETENMCYDGSNSWGNAIGTFGYLKGFFEAHTNAFTFWNMILNSKVSFMSDPWRAEKAQNSLVTINTTAKTVEYTHEFYVMKHWSYYIRTGAVRIKTAGPGNAMAFKNPDGTIILELYHGGKSPAEAVIQLGSKTIKATVDASSVTTFNIGGIEDANSWIVGDGPINRAKPLPVFSVPDPAHAISVFDLNGKLIRRIAAGDAPRLTWDGRDAAGRMARAGLYVIRYHAVSGDRFVKMLRR